MKPETEVSHRFETNFYCERWLQNTSFPLTVYKDTLFIAPTQLEDVYWTDCTLNMLHFVLVQTVLNKKVSLWTKCLSYTHFLGITDLPSSVFHLEKVDHALTGSQYYN